MKNQQRAPRLPRDGRHFSFADPTLTKEEQNILLSRASGVEGTMRRKAAYAIRFAWKNRCYRHPLAFQLSRAGHQALRLIERGDIKAASSAIQQADLLYARLWAAALHAVGSEVAEKWQGYTRTQSAKAKGPRKRIKSDSFEGNISNLIKDLASEKDDLGDYLPSDELWPMLYALLDKLGLEPKDLARPKSPVRDWAYSYDGGNIKYSTFQSTLSQIRTKPKKI